ncbi:tryptophan-rich sensory protein [Patescibacteria group bacterium]|nr:tryptophan-rich sensory protein [Patescibacteria group bacterium]
MRLQDVSKLIIAIGASELAGIVGSLFTASSIPTWYATLAKPALNPPNWIFGPVWAILYLLMGVAAFLVWRKGFRRKDVKVALAVFGGQLFLNAIWSIIFFGLKSSGWAFVEIMLLWFAIVGTMAVFYKISKPAMYLLAPYILWVSFAAYLNLAIWTLN